MVLVLSEDGSRDCQVAEACVLFAARCTMWHNFVSKCGVIVYDSKVKGRGSYGHDLDLDFFFSIILNSRFKNSEFELNSQFQMMNFQFKNIEFSIQEY